MPITTTLLQQTKPHAPAYPLEFPLWEKRTRSRKRAPFQVNFAQARDDLLRELGLLKAEHKYQKIL